MQSSSRITKQASPKNTANRFLFTLLVATVVFPLPAMTPALLSGAESALSVVTAPRAELSRFVPVYFMPTKFGRRPTAMVPDTVLLGMAEPTTIINEIGADRALSPKASTGLRFPGSGQLAAPARVVAAPSSFRHPYPSPPPGRC